jgi:hypothetical protein
MTSPESLKRGTRIEYAHAGGKVVSGRILRKAPITDWFVCKLTDEVGEYSASCHREQIRVTDNRG